MLIKLISAGIIGVKKERLPLFFFFQSIEQGSPNALDFAIRIRGKKNDFPIRRIRLQIVCQLLSGGILIKACAILKKRILYHIKKFDINLLQQAMLFPFLAFHFCQQNSYKFILHICRQYLRCTIDFEIPKISAISIQQKWIVQIPIKVHPFYCELNRLFIILFPYLFYFYLQYTASLILDFMDLESASPEEGGNPEYNNF